MQHNYHCRRLRLLQEPDCNYLRERRIKAAQPQRLTRCLGHRREVNLSESADIVVTRVSTYHEAAVDRRVVRGGHRRAAELGLATDKPRPLGLISKAVTGGVRHAANLRWAQVWRFWKVNIGVANRTGALRHWAGAYTFAVKVSDGIACLAN